MDMSPGLPSPLPWSNSKYSLSPREPNPNQTLNPSPLFGDFDNLMGGWEDPSDSAHSLVPVMDPAELHVAPNEQDDSVALDDSMNDEPLFQGPQSLLEASDVPSRRPVYSTPPSWERPRLDCQVSNVGPFAPLSPDEKSRLLAIAMPTQTPPTTPPLSPSPEPVDLRKPRKCKPRKRKSSESSESDSSYPPCSGRLPPQKSAHNLFEKRYRTNLNEKIALLRDRVPTMRVLDKDKRSGEEEDLQGLHLAQKFHKVLLYLTFLIYLTSLSLFSSSITL
jgi:hypothetical protein